MTLVPILNLKIDFNKCRLLDLLSLLCIICLAFFSVFSCFSPWVMLTGFFIVFYMVVSYIWVGMPDLMTWLVERNIHNPHLVPDEYKAEFDQLFPTHTWMWPQPGGQETFLNCPADIVFYGGEAGSGKSWCLGYDPMKWIHLPGFQGAIVRKTFPQLFGPGGMWENCRSVYSAFGARSVGGTRPRYKFPSGACMHFMHSQHASKIEHYWQGLEVPYIGLDEVTQFSKQEFLYIMSRNRSMTGINSYIRATCNPDPNSWVKDLIKWWIGEDGFVIKERCGVVRYFVHREDRFVWADTEGELKEKYGHDCLPKSFTFIRGHLEDNKKLLEKDPSYKASLQNLSEEQRRSLCEGNWNTYDDPNALFKHATINAHRVDKADFSKAVKVVIGIDPCGSTSKTSDDCGIVAGYKTSDGHCYVTHDNTGNYLPNDWAAEAIKLYDMLEADEILAESNFGGDMVKNTIEMYAKSVGRNDVNVKLVHSTRGKHIRAEPVSMLYEKGMVHHVGNGLGELEREMCGYREGQEKSPNRLDALVFMVARLLISKGKRMPRLGVIR